MLVVILILRKGEEEDMRQTQKWPVSQFEIEVVSDERTQDKFLADLEGRFAFNEVSRQLIRAPEFQIVAGATYSLQAIFGWEFEYEKGRAIANILAAGESRSWLKAPAFCAGLVREKVSDEDILALGMAELIVAHEPILLGRDPYLLSASRRGEGNRLWSQLAHPGNVLMSNDAVLFLVPR